MEKEFLPYAEALALKELGFNEPCFGFYDDIDDDHPVSFIRIESLCDKLKSSITLAPLYRQAFRFFREKYNLDVTFRKMDYGPESQFTGYYFSIYKGNELIDIHGADKKCKLYEEAELECLKKLIEIVKEK
jgi:hypothetical protein